MSRSSALAVLGVLTFLLECLPVLAADAGSKSGRKAAPALDAAALDKRISDARHVFVGEAVRIYFVDRSYRETPYIRAAGDGSVKSAMVVVKVVKPLHPAGAELPGQVLVPIETSRDAFSEGRSRYDREVDRLVGKQGIWFGEIVTRKDGNNRKALEDPVTLLMTGPADAKRRPAATPLSINHLKQVTESIERLKGGGQVAVQKAE